MDHWIIPKHPKTPHPTLATSPTSDRKCFDLGCSFTWRGNSSDILCGQEMSPGPPGTCRRSISSLLSALWTKQRWAKRSERCCYVLLNDQECPGFPGCSGSSETWGGSTGMHSAGAKKVSQHDLSLCLSRQIPPLWWACSPTPNTGTQAKHSKARFQNDI